MIQLDVADQELIHLHHWCLSSSGYVVAYVQRKVINLHRLVAERHYLLNPTDRVLHDNQDKQDNRSHNLVVISRSTHTRLQQKNKLGTSQYRGVDAIKLELKSGEEKVLYRARIKHRDRIVTIGLFDVEMDAALSYDLYIIDNNIASLTNFRGLVNTCYNKPNIQVLLQYQRRITFRKETGM